MQGTKQKLNKTHKQIKQTNNLLIKRKHKDKTNIYTLYIKTTNILLRRKDNIKQQTTKQTKQKRDNT